MAPLIFALLCSLLLSSLPAQAAGYRTVINGVAVTGTQPEMKSGQLMVAVRPFVEAMGGKVTWNANSKMVTIYYKGSIITAWVGNSLAFQNDRPIWSPVAPYLKSGSFMIPGWWLAARLGAKVSFSGSTLSVDSGKAQTPSQTLTAPASNRGSRPNHALADPSYVFPFPAGARYSGYEDTMGAARYWNGAQFGHEGIDIVAARGTPLVAVASGTVVRCGWNTLGGYRLTIQLDDHPEYRLYYAHMDGYAPGIYLGAHVKTGQLLGYVGSTGEGPEGTRGKFVDHLHFGIYLPDGSVINPYSLLRYWEGNKATLR